MRHDKLDRELKLLLLLADNRGYTIKNLCDRVGISRRNLYYYLEFFRESGFKVLKHGEVFCIDRDSPFFNRLIERISITEEEAILIRRQLTKMSSDNALVVNLKKKLERFYDFKIIPDDELSEQAAYNIGVLYEAIKLKRQVLIRHYVSLNSRTITDRIVEPFVFMNDNNEVRCFEPLSQLNKTFKISRMLKVEMLDTEWCYERKHREMFTDVFMFSSEERIPVKMIMGKLSFNILKDEFPKAVKFVTITPEGKNILDMDVCSYVGVGRFVLGLFDDIEVLGNEGFINYLKEKKAKMSNWKLS